MIGIRRVVDLSVVIDRTTQVYPGDPVPELRPATRIETEGFNVLSLSMGSHTGTHVDAPFHVQPAGAPLEGLDLGLFAGPAVIVDVTGHGPSQPIEWDDVAADAERLTPGAILLLRTGWSERHWGTDRYLEHPFLDPAACARLLERGMRTLAIDALNPDPTRPETTDLPVHHLVLGAGGVIAENLTNLSAVDDRDAIVCLFPIRLGADADGAPCRAVALELSAR
jgi:kynurenine formamidase